MNFDLLRNVSSDYNTFCSIAESLEWIAIKEVHEEWVTTYPLGIFVDAYEFPKDYVQYNIESVYVRIILSGMAFSEEWDKDFWNISQEERKKCLAEGAFLYKPYAIVQEMHFIERDWKYLAQKIEYFATLNKIPISKQKQYMDKLQGARVMEIGAYYNDVLYIAIKQDFVLVVFYGFWD